MTPAPDRDPGDDLEGDDDELGIAPPGGNRGTADRPQCTGYTIEGRRCEGIVVPGLEVCHFHLGQSDAGADRSEAPGEDRDAEDDVDDDRPIWERRPEVLHEGVDALKDGLERRAADGDERHEVQ